MPTSPLGSTVALVLLKQLVGVGGVVWSRLLISVSFYHGGVPWTEGRV